MQAAPSELPAPIDDGACDHLPGLALPAIALPSTAGRFVELDKLEVVRTVIYCYPMTGYRGCRYPRDGFDTGRPRLHTPQACSFRDHHRELASFAAQLFGLSTQTTEYQHEWPGDCICRSKS